MHFRLFVIIPLFLCNLVFAAGFESNINIVGESQQIARYQFDSRHNCDGWGWWCDIKFGLKKAESNGRNGMLLSGYAYHLPIHDPMNPRDGFNELAFGAGYTRSFYNPDYNSEYSLFVLMFKDSFAQPQIQAGYLY